MRSHPTLLRLRPVIYLVLHLLAIASAEAVTVFLDVRVGMVFYGLLLLALLVQAAWTDQGSERNVMLALSFAPLIRLLSLSLPLEHFSSSYQYLVIGLPLAIAAYLGIRAMNLSASRLGLNGRALPTQLLVAFTGLGLGYAQYRTLQPEPIVAVFRWQQIWLPALILLLVTGLLEELLFRGLMQSAAVEMLGRWGVVYVAVLFAVMQLGQRSAAVLLTAFIAGIFFGLITLRTGSILGPALAHGLTNISLYLIFPFMNSVLV